ncbi:MAG: valine--tRNA ligase, partial [Nitrospirota bacterium]
HLAKITDHDLAIGHCYRCKTVVEPYLSKQWFVRIGSLAQEAVRSVRDGEIKIIPSGWENSYFDWMQNIKDWCISRQIWWGHRIPVWYCKSCEEVIVSMETPSVCKCGSDNLVQDEDVLDTWFSSALWPFSTLGWPDDTDDLKTFYPTSVLITGFDILFFWVARMIMMGLKFMRRQPFDHVYIHALIRDAEGMKMSKSKGNVVDPLKMTDAYGTDAFRFTLAAYAAQGRDIKFNEKRVEGYGHFLNKIWNVARFISMNMNEGDRIMPLDELRSAAAGRKLTLADRWILSRLSDICADVNRSLEEYRFNDYAGTLYQFTWHELCDWYVEMIKPELYGDDAEAKKAALSTLVHVFETAISLLHPVMPYITEEVWQQLPAIKDVDSVCVRKYPDSGSGIKDSEAEDKMAVIMNVVDGIRSIRGELNISPSLELKALIKTMDGSEDVLVPNISYVTKLARAQEIKIGRDIKLPKNSATAVKPSMEIYVPLEGLIDVDAEINRLKKDLAKTEKELVFINKKLMNEDFRTKAPKAVIEENKAKYDEYKNKLQGIQESIDKLKRWKE